MGLGQRDRWREGLRPLDHRMVLRMIEHFRWMAIVTYRSERGQVDVDHHFEELSELHDLVERGPDWNAIISISVKLNPERWSYLNDTVEAAELR